MVALPINNILPKDSQFYDYDIDIPDYDFSKTAMKHAEELCMYLVKELYIMLRPRVHFSMEHIKYL